MRRFCLALLSLLVIAGGVSVAAPAVASAAPVYQVMNTSEYPPDGVYWRSGPDWSTAIRVPGHGIYAGDSVRLLCYGWGTNVPRPDGGSNTLWYQAENVYRPTSPNGTNSGWVNAHFVNDGTSANQVAPGVPQCGSAPAPTPPIVNPPPMPTPPTVTTTYFSPYGSGNWLPGGNGTVKNVPLGDWSPGKCNSSEALNDVASASSNLAGWSKGRLGPVYALAQTNDSDLGRFKTTLMIDPGSYKELTTSCDNDSVSVKYSGNKQRPGAILARWLNTNKSAYFVVYAADATADYGTLVNGRAHAGIQNVYFNDLRRANVDMNRVLVCNYTQQAGSWKGFTNHQAMYLASQSILPNPPQTSCPTLSGFNAPQGWHP